MFGKCLQKGLPVVCIGREGGQGKAGSCDVSGGVTHRDRMSKMNAQTHRVSQATGLSVKCCGTSGDVFREQVNGGVQILGKE